MFKTKILIQKYIVDVIDLRETKPVKLEEIISTNDVLYMYDNNELTKHIITSKYTKLGYQVQSVTLVSEKEIFLDLLDLWKNN
jgi:hypothetical protein